MNSKNATSNRNASNQNWHQMVVEFVIDQKCNSKGGNEEHEILSAIACCVWISSFVEFQNSPAYAFWQPVIVSQDLHAPPLTASLTSVFRLHPI